MRRMMNLMIAVVMATAIHVAAMAQTDTAKLNGNDSLDSSSREAFLSRTMEHVDLWKQISYERNGNPAVQSDRYATGLSQIQVYWQRTGLDKPIVLQEGSGRTIYGAEASTFMPLGKRNTIWGAASYQAGKKNDIRWCETSDYALLYPYVLADTLGGEMQNERYAFNGGCATRLGQFVIGEELDFRAEHEYRSTDPRPRGIVTDMTLRLGVAYVLPEYTVGVAVGGRFYKQTNDVDFYKESGVIAEYQMTGLGSDYKRFRGANRDAYYKSTGWIASVNLMPKGKQGCFVDTELSDLPVQRILTTLNSMPISKLYVTRMTSRMGWKDESERMGWRAFAGADLQWRQGDELIAGSSSSTEYDEMGHLTMYKNRLTDLYLGFAMRTGLKNRLTAECQLGYQDYWSRYVYPERKFSFDKIYGSLRSQLLIPFDRWLIATSLSASYFKNTNDKTVMPYGLMDSNNRYMVDYLTASSAADFVTCDLGFRADYQPKGWGGYALFGRLDAGLVHSTYSDNAATVRLALGLTF